MIAELEISRVAKDLGKPDKRALQQHLDEIVELCRNTNIASLEAYLDPLRDEICGMCDYQRDFSCACPLQALVPLAVAAIEMRRAQDTSVTESLTWNDAEMPESD